MQPFRPRHLVLGFAMLLPAATSLQAQGIAPLAPFIGVWQTEDTYYPLSGSPIVERAVRTCASVMQATYLQCETVSQRATGSRTYRFLINYNRTTARFEMISIWSNVPHKLIQSLTPNSDGSRWQVANLAVVGDDEPMSAHWSEIVVESADRIVWTGRRITDGGDPAAAPLSFRETWTRTP